MPEVSKGKVHINQNRNVPIEFDCDLLNTSHLMSTSHSISHATLFCWWLEQGSLEGVHCCLTTKYYCVLQVLLLRTSKHYKVLHSTTPYYTVLQCTTQYYNVLQSIALYYKVLLRTTQYYNLLHSTTMYYKVLLRTTKYYSILQSIARYYTVLQCATKYCSVLQRTTK